MTAEELRLLVDILRKESGDGTHLEIGTGAGGTLCVMMSSFDSKRRPPFCVVDTMRYFPNQFEAIKRNLVLHQLDPANVDFRISRSAVAFTRAETKREVFAFILIDGSHKVRAVMDDLRWTRLVGTGGIVCLHDYSRRFLGVKIAVDYFLWRNRNYRRIAQAGSLIALRKTSNTSAREVGRVDELFALFLHFPLKAWNWLRR